MLGQLPTYSAHHKVFRLANQTPLTQFLQDEGYSPDEAQEIIGLCESRSLNDSPDDLCNRPFKRKQNLSRQTHQTRYSDGSFNVFYSSLEAETAKHEMRFWFAHRFVGVPSLPRHVFYRLFHCSFSGEVKDLRPKFLEWPQLTDSDDYEFCNELGLDAIRLGLDGLIAPSARRKNGNNLPIFTQKSVSSPVIDSLVIISYDPQTRSTSISEVKTES